MEMRPVGPEQEKDEQRHSGDVQHHEDPRRDKTIKILVIVKTAHHVVVRSQRPVSAKSFTPFIKILNVIARHNLENSRAASCCFA